MRWWSVSGIAAAAALGAGIVVTVGAGRLSADTYEHARALGARCSTCHDSTRPHLANLNDAGRHFLRYRSLDGYKPAAVPAAQASGRQPAAPAPGLAVYTRSCAACHGPKGEGTVLAGALNGPRKHAATQAAAIEVITNGIKGTAMASFRNALTEQEIIDVAKYVTSLLPGPARK